ncbi:MAG: signal transduction histidine kinase [Proteobacteria bacterium]|nr:signal transduction histidine kinase [Pseudomonadota bacterium]
MRTLIRAWLSGSLRQRLALILLPTLILLLIASGVTQYLLAIRPIQQEFDRAMGDAALALADRIDVNDDGDIVFDLSDETASLLEADQVDRVWYAAFDDALKPFAGTLNLVWPTAKLVRGEPYIFSTELAGQHVRAVAMMKSCGVMDCGVVLAQTTHKRERLIRDVLLSALLPVLLLGLATLALVWFGIGRGLLPLVSLSREIGRRSPRELSPLNAEDAPEEALPLVEAVNRLMSQLGEAGQAQQRFLATAAHQLRTPLAGLQSRIELAQIEAQDVISQRNLAEIHESAVRAARLAVQLLSLARVEPGVSVVDATVSVDLARLATELVDEWVPRAIARRIDLGFDLQPASVTGQPLLLREMMVNLLHNALEYIPAGGRITLHTGRQGDASFFGVEDNGPGIPVEMRAKVLERFARLPGSRGSGSGLGLAIVQEIAEGHRARFELLDAPAGGHGLLAQVSFPDQPSASTSAEKSGSS